MINNFKKNCDKVFSICNRSTFSVIKNIIPWTILLSILDFLSIALLVPIMSEISTKLKDNISLDELIQNDQTKFLFLIIISFVIISKLFIAPFLVKKYMSNVLNIRKDLSFGILNILSQRSSVTQDGFANVVHHSINEVNLIINKIILPGITIIIETLVFIFIIFGIFYFNFFFGIIGLALCLLSLLIVYKISFGALSKAGIKRVFWERNRLGAAKDFFYLYEESYIYNKLEYSSQRYVNSTDESNKAALVVEIYRAISRYLIDVVFFIAIICSIFLLFALDSNLSTFSSFAILSLIRLMPSINRFIYSGQNLRYGYQSFQNLFELSKDFDSFKLYKQNFPDVIELDEEVVIEFKNVNIFKNQKLILKNINTNFNVTGVTFVSGDSGSGKTTFLRTICGLEKEMDGQVYLIDNDKKLCSTFFSSYVSQSVYLFEGLLSENITLSSDYDLMFLKDVVRICRIDDFIKIKNLKNTNITDLGSNLSGGQRARIALARAIFFKRPILILDETLSGIDEKTAELIIEDLINLEWIKSIIISSHSSRLIKSKYKKILIKNNRII